MPRGQYTFPGPPPKEALAYFRAKKLRTGFDHTDVWGEEHVTSFTVAKAMELDVLTSIREAVDRAAAEGRTMREFARRLKPELQRLGWWGRKEMTDPVTGEVREVQLGSPRRLKTIYQTNLRTARAAGQWDRIERTKTTHPYLLYELGPSREHRTEHAAWAGVLLPVDDPWWRTHFPINGWGCKCRVRQVSKAEAARLDKTGVQAPSPKQEVDPDTGLPTGHMEAARIPVRRQAPPVRTREWKNIRTGEVHQVPEGIDPGWDYNAGKVSRAHRAAKLYADKVAAAPSDLGAASFAAVPREVLNNLAAEYRSWAADIRKGEQVGLGGRRVVGAMNSKVLQALGEKVGVTPASAALTIEQREVSHLLAGGRKGSKALPEELVMNLVDLLADPQAVVWDGAGKRPALLYVVEIPESDKLGRIVIRVDYPAKKGTTNAVRSAGVVEAVNLKSPGMILLDGEIK